MAPHPPAHDTHAASPAEAVRGVLGWPAFSNRAEQPYNALLYTALRGLGVAVEEASVARVLSGRYSILHLHWPDRRVRARGTLAAMARSAGLVALLDIAHARGMRVVWTVHNLYAHEGTHRPWLEPAYWRALTRRVDAFTTLSAMGVTMVREHFVALRDRPGFASAHGHLRGVYPEGIDRAAARRELRLPADARVIAFLGQIRPYKNTVELVRAFRRVDDAACRLVIAGQARPQALANELRSAAAGDERILVHPDFVPDDRLQIYLRAADLVALPYRDIFNSGSALLALSFDRPVLVPAIGAMPELAQTFGEGWVRAYTGELTAATLAEAIAWAVHGERAPTPPLDAFGWERIARATLAAFESVLRER